MPSSLFFRPTLLILLWVASFLSVRGEIIFDNSSETGGTNVYYPEALVLEHGDEITLGGTNRVITQFSFEYYGDFTSPQGDETARIRVYRNDGAVNSQGAAVPGTLLYDSGSFSIGAGYTTKKFTGLNIAVPKTLTWTISFGGISGLQGDRAGLILGPAVTIGSSFRDFWIRDNTGWHLNKFPNYTPPANFVVRLISGSEPTTVAIRRESNKVILDWTGLSILQVATSASGPYSDIANARNHYEISVGVAAMKFWRLRD